MYEFSSSCPGSASVLNEFLASKKPASHYDLLFFHNRLLWGYFAKAIRTLVVFVICIHVFWCDCNRLGIFLQSDAQNKFKKPKKWSVFLVLNNLISKALFGLLGPEVPLFEDRKFVQENPPVRGRNHIWKNSISNQIFLCYSLQLRCLEFVGSNHWLLSQYVK